MISTLLASASASPLGRRQLEGLGSLGGGGGGGEGDSGSSGGCKSVTFIFARGSAEPGTLVRTGKTYQNSPLTFSRASLLVLECAGHFNKNSTMMLIARVLAVATAPILPRMRCRKSSHRANATSVY